MPSKHSCRLGGPSTPAQIFAEWGFSGHGVYWGRGAKTPDRSVTVHAEAIAMEMSNLRQLGLESDRPRVPTWSESAERLFLFSSPTPSDVRFCRIKKISPKQTRPISRKPAVRLAKRAFLQCFPSFGPFVAALPEQSKLLFVQPYSDFGIYAKVSENHHCTEYFAS